MTAPATSTISSTTPVIPGVTAPAAPAARTFTRAAIDGQNYMLVPNAQGQNLYLHEETFQVIDKLLFEENGNVFIYGPKGTAKSEMAEVIGALRGLRYRQQETGAIVSGDQLDGERTIDPATGSIKVIYSELMLAVKDAAAGIDNLLNIDEINRVQAAAAVNKLLRLTSGQREYATDMEGVLSVGTHLKLVATANIGYHGTIKLNEAFLDRFYAVKSQEIGGKVLRTMLDERYGTGVDARTLDRLVRFVDNSRKAALDNPEEAQPVSTRDALRICAGIRIGMTPIQAIKVLLGGQLEIQQVGTEGIEALITDANSQFLA